NGQIKRALKDASQQLLNKQEVSELIKVLDQEVVHLQEQCTAIAERQPNLPHESVPVGADEAPNVQDRRWSKPKTFS
ncbi:serine--tRNA ligase, partial [Enterococcus faecalis]